MAKSEHRQFTQKLKRNAVNLVMGKGALMRKVARDLDIHPNLVHHRARFVPLIDTLGIGISYFNIVRKYPVHRKKNRVQFFLRTSFSKEEIIEEICRTLLIWAAFPIIFSSGWSYCDSVWA